MLLLNHSDLRFVASVWDPYLQKDIDRIENIQRRGARFVKDDYKMTNSVTEMTTDLNWKLLAERRREQRLVLLYKIINGLVATPADRHITPKNRPSRTSRQVRKIAANTDI